MQIGALIKKHPLKFTISVLVSLGLVYYAFKDLEWPAFWESLKTINYWLLTLGAAVLIFSNVVRAARWRILLLPQKKLKRRFLFEATMMGYMGNNVLPFKLGEVLRGVVISRRHDIKLSGVGASIVVERGLDMIFFLILAGIYGLLVPEFEAARLLSILGFMALLLVLVFGFWVNRHHDLFAAKVDHWAERYRTAGQAKRADHLISIFKGLETLWHMPKPVHVILQSIFLWMLYLLVTILALAAFNFQLDLLELWRVSLVLLIFTTLSLSIPATPGYVGTYHTAVLTALLLFNIDSNQARSFAIVLHLMNYLIYTPIGAWYLMKAGLSLDLANEENLP